MRSLVLSLCLVLPFGAQGAHIVSTVAELRHAVSSSLPGDSILMRPGAYDFDGPLTITTSGLPGRPIVVGALRTGQSTLRGDSRFFLDRVSHVEIRGLVFMSVNGPAVRLRGCTRVRLTRNTFHLREDTRSHWVLITGFPGDTAALSRGNRVDHNLFEKKRELGNFLTIEGTKARRFQVSQDDTIEHNCFRDIGPRVENGLEAIRIGSSDFSLSSGHTLLEDNLFERCDGDPEYVSIKSSDNIIRRNTFRACLGVLSLRHGNRNRIEENFIFGNGRTGVFRDSTGRVWKLGTGGIRLYGDSMVIVNNYLEGLTGTRWDASLAITNGNAEYGDGQPLTKHFRIRDALIAFNTFIDNATAIEIGYDGGGFQGNWWSLPPSGLTIANNIIVGRKDTLVKMFASPVGSRWEGNIIFAEKGAIACGRELNGVAFDNPGLAKVRGFWRLVRGSRAIGAAVGTYLSIRRDIDGQPRGDRKDVGADQYSRRPILSRPLREGDVGPGSPD